MVVVVVVVMVVVGDGVSHKLRILSFIVLAGVFFGAASLWFCSGVIARVAVFSVASFAMGFYGCWLCSDDEFILKISG